MHYTEIEMAESMSTPTKISARDPVSQAKLCCGSHESRYMLSRPTSKAREKHQGDKVEPAWQAFEREGEGN